MEEDTITRKEMYDTNLGYIDLLLKATDFKPQRWNDLLSIYDEVDPDIRKKIKEKLLFEIAQHICSLSIFSLLTLIYSMKTPFCQS